MYTFHMLRIIAGGDQLLRTRMYVSERGLKNSGPEAKRNIRSTHLPFSVPLGLATLMNENVFFM